MQATTSATRATSDHAPDEVPGEPDPGEGVHDADELDDDALERELAELTGHLDAAVHRQITLIRRVDESGRWARQGAKTCAHWLSWRIKMDVGTAREKLRVGHALVQLPCIDAAFASAELSYSQVRAMTRVATPDNEERLLALAESSTASQLERICRGVRQATRAEGAPGSDGDLLDRWVRYRPMGDGTARVEMQLGADEAYRVMEELRKTQKQMRGGDAKPSMAGRGGADDRAADHEPPPPGQRTVPEVETAMTRDRRSRSRTPGPSSSKTGPNTPTRTRPNTAARSRASTPARTRLETEVSRRPMSPPKRLPSPAAWPRPARAAFPRKGGSPPWPTPSPPTFPRERSPP